MEEDFKCYKFNPDPIKEDEVQNIHDNLQNSTHIQSTRYKIVDMYQKEYRKYFLIENLETKSTKEFGYTDVQLYFYSEYLVFMQSRSKNKKRNS